MVCYDESTALHHFVTKANNQTNSPDRFASREQRLREIILCIGRHLLVFGEMRAGVRDSKILYPCQDIDFRTCLDSIVKQLNPPGVNHSNGNVKSQFKTYLWSELLNNK